MERSRWRRVVWWMVFAAGALFAVRAAVAWAAVELGFYDEGILFTDAFLMNQGRVLYRDFYANYAPGIFQVIRLILALGLPPIWSARVLALVVDVACAVGAGLVAGRVRREGICLAAATAVVVLRSNIGLVMSAYKVAVLLALATMLLWPDEGSSRARRIACGVTLGMVSYFRQDLFTYGVVLLGSFELVHALARRRSLLGGSARQLAELAAATAATVLLLWVPVLIESGLSRTAHDLALDMASRVMPGRTLPLPSFLAPVDVPALGLRLPALVATRLCVCLLLAGAGTAAAAVALLVRAGRREPSARELRSAALLTAFAAATLPQALMRTEYGHVALGLPLTAAALFGILGRRIGVPVVLLALLASVAEHPRLAGLDEALRFLKQRDDAHFTTPQRGELVRFLENETGSQEPIFVGCTSHRRVLANPFDVYYLARRTGATRYMHFDPGNVTSASGQSEMIADLERHRPRIALRHPKCAWDEPNASMVEGSGLLDAYLAAHYAPSGMVGGLEVWRRSAEAPASTSGAGGSGATGPAAGGGRR